MKKSYKLTLAIATLLTITLTFTLIFQWGAKPENSTISENNGHTTTWLDQESDEDKDMLANVEAENEKKLQALIDSLHMEKSRETVLNYFIKNQSENDKLLLWYLAKFPESEELFYNCFQKKYGEERYRLCLHKSNNTVITERSYQLLTQHLYNERSTWEKKCSLFSLTRDYAKKNNMQKQYSTALQKNIDKLLSTGYENTDENYKKQFGHDLWLDTLLLTLWVNIYNEFTNEEAIQILNKLLQKTTPCLPDEKTCMKRIIQNSIDNLKQEELENQ